ncbi:MAG: hypothetical protein KAR19_15395 [Bacteroidales bacterium]|nr:hypothetical protein [Bacteroidales bacterium]
MKYIVLYTLALFLINTPEASGQKPAIDLLPSSHEHIHPEAVIDTSYIRDSLIQITPGAKQESKPVKEIPMKESRRTGLHLDSILNKLVSKKLNQVTEAGIILIYRSISIQ